MDALLDVDVGEVVQPAAIRAAATVNAE